MKTQDFSFETQRPLFSQQLELLACPGGVEIFWKWLFNTGIMGLNEVWLLLACFTWMPNRSPGVKPRFIGSVPLETRHTMRLLVHFWPWKQLIISLQGPFSCCSGAFTQSPSEDKSLELGLRSWKFFKGHTNKTSKELLEKV